LGRDWRAGRLYVPREVYERHAVGEEQLRGGTMTSGWGDAMAECVRVTADLFADGRDVCNAVAGRLPYELRLTWLGGRRVLELVDANRVDLLTTRPKLGAADAPAILWRAWRWTAQR